jgi:hypothetical protein
MNSDIEALKDLNARIIEAENSGGREWLASILAPRLVIQRADGTVDDQVTFLQKVQPGGDRISRIIEPIRLYGDRAIVQFVVTTRGRRIDNLQLFVRRDGEWKLLGWANAPVPPGA